MKRTLVFVAILVSAFANEARCVWGQQFALESIEAKDRENLNVAGLDLSKFGYEQIDNYLSDNGALYVLGVLKEPVEAGITKFSKVDVLGKRESVMAIYDSVLNFDPKFIVFEVRDAEGGFPYVLLEYTGGDLVSHFDLREYMIDIFRTANGTDYELANREKIAENSVAGWVNEDQQYDYWYLADGNGDENEPAVREVVSELSVKDADGDGYRDVVIRKLTFKARKIGDSGNWGKGDYFISQHLFQLTDDVTLVMCFLKDEMKFSAPRQMDVKK